MGEDVEMPSKKEWNPHAFHRNLPPHHIDVDGVPFVTKFAEKKARQIVHLAHSIQLEESLFAAEKEPEDDMEDDEDEEDEETEEDDDPRAHPSQDTLASIMKKCARLHAQLTTLEGLKHGGISQIEMCEMILHLLRLVTATISVEYAVDAEDSTAESPRRLRKVKLHYEDVGYLFNEDGQGTEQDYQNASTSEQLEKELSRSFALPVPARESLLSVLIAMLSKKDRLRAFSSSALYPEGADHSARVMLILHWKALLRMLLRTAPYLDEHKVGNPPICSSSRQSNIVRRSVQLIRHARHFFDQGIRPPNMGSPRGPLDGTARNVWNMVRTDVLYHTHTHACYRGLILLYLFHPTRCSTQFYLEVLPQWLESWSSIDRCPDFDFLWLVMFCRARKHVAADKYDWGPLRRRLLTHGQHWLQLPVGGSSMDKTFPRASNPRSRSCPARLKMFVGSGSNYEEGIDFVAKVTKLLVACIGADDLISDSENQTKDQPGTSDGTADLLRFFSFVAPYFNPSNVGTWTFTLGAFLHYFCYELCHRVGVESSLEALRRSKPNLASSLCDAEPRLATMRTPPGEMVALMHAILPLCQQALYSKNGHVGRAGEAAMLFLSQIDPINVTPPFLDFASSALDFSAVNLSHQAPSALSALTRLVQPALRKRPSILLCRLPDILRLSLAGIDSNDQNKTIRTLIFYRNLTSWIPVASDARNWPVLKVSPSETDDAGNGMIHLVENIPHVLASFTESEEYADAIAKLPETSVLRQSDSFYEADRFDSLLEEAGAAMGDWVLSFLDRIYELLRASGEREKAGKNGSRVASRHSSSDVQQARNFSRVLKECLNQVFASMDEEIHSVAVRSVTQFLSEESLPSAAKDASFLCQAAAAVRESGGSDKLTRSPGFQCLVPVLLENLERCSKKTVVYHLRCLAGAVRYAGRHVVEHGDEITRALSFALMSDDKDVYKTGCKLLRQTLASQCESYPVVSASMPRIESDDDSISARALGKSARLTGDPVHWHVPDGEQVDYACRLLENHVMKQVNDVLDSYNKSELNTIQAGLVDLGCKSGDEETRTIDAVSFRRCLRVVRYALRGGAGLLLDSFDLENRSDRQESEEVTFSETHVPYEQAVLRLLLKTSKDCMMSLCTTRGRICGFIVALMSLVGSETIDSGGDLLGRSEAEGSQGVQKSSGKYHLSSDTKICKELSEIALLLLTRRGANFRCQEGKTIWRAQKQLVTNYATAALAYHTSSVLQRASCYGDGKNLLYKDGEEGGKCLTRRLLVARLQLFSEAIQRNASFEVPRRLRKLQRTAAHAETRLFTVDISADELADSARNSVHHSLACYEALIDGLFALSCHSNTHVRAAAIGVVDYAFTRFGWLARSRVSRLLSAVSLEDREMKGMFGVPSCSLLSEQVDHQGKRKRLAEVLKGVCSILALPRASRQTLVTEESRSVFVRTLCKSDQIISLLPIEEMQKMVLYFQNIFAPFRSKFFSLPRTTDRDQYIHESCLNFLLDMLSTESSDREEKGKEEAATSGERDSHWKERLLVGWFITNLVDEQDVAVAGRSLFSRLWSVSLRLLETETGQPLQRVGVGLLGRLVSLLLRGTEETLECVNGKMSDDLYRTLGIALAYDHRVDTSVGGGHSAQWSAGIEDILRDSSRFVAPRTMFPFQRTSQSSGTFKVSHAQLVESILLLVNEETSQKASESLLNLARELAVAPPSEDQRNQQVTSAELFAGVAKAQLVNNRRRENQWDSVLIGYLEEMIPKFPISLTGAYFDAIRYSIQSCSPLQTLPLASWLVAKIDSLLWKPGESTAVDSNGSLENRADSSSRGTDGFTVQSKWLYLTSAVIIEMDEESDILLKPSWYRAYLQNDFEETASDFESSTAPWTLVRDRLLPRLLEAVGHPYESCRDHISGCTFRIWCCQQKIACQAMRWGEISGDEDTGSAGSLILQRFASIEKSSDLHFRERYNALITARKFMSFCIHLGDAKREFSRLVVPMLPLAFESLKITIDDGETSVDDEGAAKRALEADVVKGFRYMITEVASSCVASYKGGEEDINQILVYVENSSRHDIWQVRQAAAHFLRCFQGSHKFLFRHEHATKATGIVATLLSDERREVSSAAMAALTGILAATSIEVVTSLVKKYASIADRSKTIMKKKKADIKVSACNDDDLKAGEIKEAKRARNQQTSVFFLCASILAQPYQTPPYVPVALAAISKHSFERSAPLNVRETVKKCCAEYKRTHMSDNWEMHRRAFTTEQLEALDDVVSSPHYYA